MKESHARANCLSRRENVETRNFAMHTREFTMGGNKFCSYRNQVLPQPQGLLSTESLLLSAISADVKEQVDRVLTNIISLFFFKVL